MNDQQICTLIAKTQNIRAAHIADALDTPLVDVSASLRSLVDVGDLVKSTHFDDATGRQWQVYALSDEYKKSREFKALKLDGALGAAATVDPKPVPAQTGMPASAAPPAATGSKVDRAIACITKLGSATEDQLRDAMGLLPKAYVGAYLASALKAGRVARDGDRWKLGAGKPQRPAEQLVHDQGSVVRVGNVIVATRDSTVVPTEVKAALTEMATAAVTELRKPEPAPPAARVAAAPKAYRCAVWSDSMVEIWKSGTAVRITQDELEEIAAFVAERRVA